MRRFFVVSALALALTVMAAAQQPKPKTFTNADVIKLAKAGLDDSTIVLAIQQHPAQYDTSADALIDLKTQGVSQAVINAMLTAGKGAAPAAAPADGAGSGGDAAGGSGSQWHKVESKSALDDSTTVGFALKAEDSIEGPVGQSTPVLIVRCQDKKVEVFISTGMPASVEEGTDDHHVRLRFDSDAPQVEAWSEATNNEALFAPEPARLIKALAGAKKMAFGFTPFDANPQVAVFNVAGLGHQLAQTSGTCGWDTTFAGYK
ncbi:MAG TPA: hypothetical protein VE825_15340 [Terriglobales bacterium]|nr:hypothetical protein [Terriglobales bacterium]